MRHPYEHLSREQRIRRIGEILSKAVTLYVMKKRDAERAAGVAEVAATIQETDPDRVTRDIVEFLKRVGWASPREIRLRLDVSQRTCARRLRAMLAGGVLETRGLTTGTQYRIRAAAQASALPIGGLR